METFSALLALCEGNSQVVFPHKGQWRGALLFPLICAWTNGWVNNLDAGDLRRHRAQYDVTVMFTIQFSWKFSMLSSKFSWADRYETYNSHANYAVLTCTGNCCIIMTRYEIISGEENIYLISIVIMENTLTHWGRITHICVGKLTTNGSDTATSHYLNQCWDIVNWTHGNKLQWKLNRNLYISIQENAFVNVVWKMAAILSRPQCVNEIGVRCVVARLSVGGHWQSWCWQKIQRVISLESSLVIAYFVWTPVGWIYMPSGDLAVF